MDLLQAQQLCGLYLLEGSAMRTLGETQHDSDSQRIMEALTEFAASTTTATTVVLRRAGSE